VVPEKFQQHLVNPLDNCVRQYDNEQQGKEWIDYQYYELLLLAYFIFLNFLFGLCSYCIPVPASNAHTAKINLPNIVSLLQSVHSEISDKIAIHDHKCHDELCAALNVVAFFDL
jgi:hypothetical protein